MVPSSAVALEPSRTAEQCGPDRARCMWVSRPLVTWPAGSKLKALIPQGVPAALRVTGPMRPGKQGVGKDSDRTQPIGLLSPVPLLNRSRMLQADALTVHWSSWLVRTSRIPQKLSLPTCARYWPPGVTVQVAALVLADATAGRVPAPRARASAPLASMTALRRACMGGPPRFAGGADHEAGDGGCRG